MPGPSLQAKLSPLSGPLGPRSEVGGAEEAAPLTPSATVPVALRASPCLALGACSMLWVFGLLHLSFHLLCSHLHGSDPLPSSPSFPPSSSNFSILCLFPFSSLVPTLL